MRKALWVAAVGSVVGLGIAGGAMAQGGRHHGGPHGGMGFAAGEAFARADGNGDGKVTLEEGRAWLQARFAEADADRDGGVTLDELVAFMRAQRPAGRAEPPPDRQARMREGLARGFRFVDANGDGKVSFAELEPMATAMFRATDRDGDGAVSRAELRPARGAEGPRRGGPEAPPAR